MRVTHVEFIAAMLSQPLDQMLANITGYTHPANYSSFSYNAVHPIEPGGVTIVGLESTIVRAYASGKRSMYADVSGAYLPPALQENATLDTIYDMASLTKLFTTTAALQQIDKKTLHLNTTVAKYVAEFAANGKENVTILQLMTHTSGFAPDPVPPLYSASYTTHAQRITAILEQPLLNVPGSTYVYSDLNFMSLQLVLEAITQRPLDSLVADFTVPLGMKDTFFNRGNLEGAFNPYYDRTAPTEFQIELFGEGEPNRPQPVRGSVHDENAYSLDGVSGHAGIFSTAFDTAILCQMILNNGTYKSHRILSPAAVDLIFTNFNGRFPGDAHGIGWELDQYYTAGPMASLQTASHTGFTGTSVVIDRDSGTFYLHLANRVHPSREWSSNNIVREAVGYWVAKSLGRDVLFPVL